MTTHRRTVGVLMVLVLALASCAGSAPAAVGDCVREDTANLVLGTFPDKVDCPTGQRSIQERLSDTIYKVVAVGNSVAEVDADPACGDDLTFIVWYDDD